MQPIHNPALELRKNLQTDIDRFIQNGGKIDVKPLMQTQVKISKQFSLDCAKKEFKKAQAKRKASGEVTIDVQFCKKSGVHHLYNGKVRLSTKGYLNEQVARLAADKMQNSLNLKARMK